MKTLIVIPARMESERLPGKPLIDIAGKTLIQRTYERARLMLSPKEGGVVVATPNKEIADHCIQNDMLVAFTSPGHSTGTHRCEETLELYEDKFGEVFDCVVNWQCDEPCVGPEDVRRMIECATADRLHGGRANIVTLVAPITEDERRNPDIAKAVCLPAIKGGIVCHWFSRAPMAGSYGHIGVYVFNPRTLHDLGTLPVCGRYAKAESLEQLSWFGLCEIGAVSTLKMPPAANTPEDIEKLRKEFADEVPPPSVN